MQTEQEQTIEFLKIRLMEREREVADFETKNKKIEFKHARDIRESKIAEERAKNMLKEEKKRSDRVNAQLKESQQQNRLLNLRLADLREQKERELAEIRCQYNALKEEVRSYERILPTLTFLEDYGLKMEELPPYEDVFILSRSQTAELFSLRHQLSEAKLTHTEEIRVLKQNEELLQVKKEQIQKALKETLPKLVDLQQQVSELKIRNQECQDQVGRLREEREVLEERGEALAATVREYELKFQELDRAYSSQLLSKEDELRALTQEQFDRYESDLQTLENRLQLKDKMYLQQIAILQQEVYYLQSKLSQQKQHFQENYLVLKEQIDKMREEVQNQRYQHLQLKNLHEELKKEMRCAVQGKELLEKKIRMQESKIEALKRVEEHQVRTFSDDQISKLENMEHNYNIIYQQYETVLANLKNVEEDRALLQEQLAVMKEEVARNNTPIHHTLEVPQSLFTFGEHLRKQSANAEDLGLEQLTSINEESGKEEQNSFAKRESESSRKESVELREKIDTLVKDLQEQSQNLKAKDSNYCFLKKKTQNLEYQNSLLTEECKQEKELVKKLKEELKQLKESNVQQTEKIIKQRKEIYLNYDALKVEKEKIKNKMLSAEKELTELKKITEEKEKLQHTLKTLQTEYDQLDEENIKLGESIAKLTLSEAEVRKDKEVIVEALKRKEKQNVALEESLVRERKERTLLAVPSLQKIDNDSKNKAFNEIYSVVTEKQSKISFLEREISDLKEELEGLKLSFHSKLQAMEEEQNSYIQTIIEMKIRCAQSEMKASESQYLYSKLKKKMGGKDNV